MAAGFAVGWPDQSVDVEDLAQELVEHWWLRRSKFSPDGPAAMKTVAHTVMRRKLIDLHDKAVAAKRGGGRVAVSRDPSAKDDEPDDEPLVELLPDDDDGVGKWSLASLAQKTSIGFGPRFHPKTECPSTPC